MRIIQVTPRYPPRTGGVETHVKELSERLVNRGHDVTVLTADDGDDVQTQESRNGVEVLRHRGFAPSGAFHIAPGILSTLFGTDADIVHAHNYHSFPLLFAAVAARDARFIASPHYHGGSASSFRDRLLSVYRPVGGWALHRAAELIAVSDWERDQLADDFRTDARVVPNGVDIGRFRDAEPRVRERPYLLTVGRLEVYKGVQHVIRALPHLPEYDLLVAGSGPHRESLERLAETVGIADRVTFLGYVDDNDLPALYAGAEAYVTMSSFEAYGMTVAEALAAETPCVVRKKAALADWLDRSGCIGVDRLSPKEVASSIETAVGVTEFASPISWEEMTDRVQRIYC